MKTEKIPSGCADALRGKCIAITGSTGGLGGELCAAFAASGASLILLDRNPKRSQAHAERLRERFGCKVTCVTLDLELLTSANAALEHLEALRPEIFIHNAGAYAIKRHPTESGYDNVFQINFATPYYLIRRLLPTLRAKNGHVVIVGSIAHHLSHINPEDVDFSGSRSDMRAYGNAKRYLILATEALIAAETQVTLSVSHPGITPTNITSHYPRPINALVKPPMRLIFPPPRRAVRSVLAGVTDTTATGEWIGPRILGVWGRPRKKARLSTNPDEQAKAAQIADEVFARCLACAEAAQTENGR